MPVKGDNLKNTIIGKGWAFPPAFDLVTQEACMVTGEEDIMQSLQILFATQVGERVLELSYGCEVSSLLFQNISLSQKTILENRVEQAIINFESRILLHQVEVDASRSNEGIIHILVDFTINRTNSRQNVVFPFFIKEGTLVPGN